MNVTDREDVKREPLTPPKVERATEMGMIHAMTPSSFSPNVCDKRGHVRTMFRLCIDREEPLGGDIRQEYKGVQMTRIYSPRQPRSRQAAPEDS